MKKGLFAITALLLAGLAAAAEEKEPRFTPEHLQRLTAPIPEEHIKLVSEPNSRGQHIIVFRSRRRAEAAVIL